MDLKTIKPVSRQLTLEDGQTIGLTLNFLLLWKLKAAKKSVYNAFFRFFGASKKDDVDPIFGSVDVVYAAYHCNCLLNGTTPMDYETFLSLLPPDLEQVMKLSTELISPKKAAASAKPVGKETPDAEAE